MPITSGFIKNLPRYSVLLASLCAPVTAPGADWSSWRGPEQNGVSRETSFPETWSKEGKAGDNVVWKLPHGGRSTPIVMNGRVYLVRRTGSGKTEQEGVLCLDAETGHLHWEYRFNIFLTDIPSNRVGWASPCGDPETGNVYVQGVQGTFLCLNRDGKVVWQRSLHEEFGVISGYGGRTSSPIVDGDLAIVSFINSSWGAHGKPKHRYLALDKRTGQIVWWADPGDGFFDTTYSVPVVGVVNGVRLLLDGNADGGVHAIKVRTGEKVWDFKLSERGINASVVFWKDRVFVCHSEENLDSTAMGRIVCIDATGKGDVTKTHEKWRIDGVTAGYSSPLVVDGRLYLFDNSANLLAMDGETGKVLWRHSVGTVMKASPVWVDGKIYVGEVNGRFVVLKPEDTSCKTLSENNWTTQDGSVIEVNGSPAVSNGRIYFTTRDETYCLGFKNWKGASGTIPPLSPEAPPDPGSAPGHLQIVPADLVLHPGQSAVLTARLFDSMGRFLGTSKGTWTVKGLKGMVSETGKIVVAADATFGSGTVEARVDALAGESRVRVLPTIPFKLDFEKIDDGKPPAGWVGSGLKFLVGTLGGQKALKKVANDARFADGEGFFGLPTWKDYTIQADILGTEARRQMPNVTLVNSGYQLLLMGVQQRLRIVSWIPQPRLDQTLSFSWKPSVWYTMKFRYEIVGEKGLLRGKVWPRDETEPAAWTIELEDPIPSSGGSPGIQAYAAGITAKSPGAEAYFDNLQVTNNER